jgi:hypothetical protein
VYGSRARSGEPSWRRATGSSDAKWSSDGKRLSFLADAAGRATGGTRSSAPVRVDGSAFKSSGPGTGARWSPDGSRLVVSGARRSKRRRSLRRERGWRTPRAPPGQRTAQAYRQAGRPTAGGSCSRSSTTKAPATYVNGDVYVVNADGTGVAPAHLPIRRRRGSGLVPGRKADPVHEESHGAIADLRDAPRHGRICATCQECAPTSSIPVGGEGVARGRARARRRRCGANLAGSSTRRRRTAVSIVHRQGRLLLVFASAGRQRRSRPARRRGAASTRDADVAGRSAPGATHCRRGCATSVRDARATGTSPASSGTSCAG